MPKIISLNIETNKHYVTVLPFLDHEAPDILCLQEAPESFATELHKRGYQTCYAPMIIKKIKNEELSIGILIASKHPFDYQKNYYLKSESEVTLHNPINPEKTLALPYLMADVKTNEGYFKIATTHMIVTNDGKENVIQTQMTKELLALITKEDSHVLCGDFNIPRGHNALYNEMTKHYTDTIPLHFKSSLDRNLHRLGNSTTLNAPIFDEYMVDYIFTQPPYIASEVRLQFGVSDHAAVIATLITA